MIPTLLVPPRVTLYPAIANSTRSCTLGRALSRIIAARHLCHSCFTGNGILLFPECRSWCCPEEMTPNGWSAVKAVATLATECSLREIHLSTGCCPCTSARKSVLWCSWLRSWKIGEGQTSLDSSGGAHGRDLSPLSPSRGLSFKIVRWESGTGLWSALRKREMSG